MKQNRKKVAVLFGGRSAEHEISVITALQLMEALDSTIYEAIPVYIASDGRWFTGAELLSRSFYQSLPGSLSKVEEVTLLPTPTSRGLVRLGSSDPYATGQSSQNRIEVDIYLPAFHGQFGEDGCLQGLFEMANVPYSGCGVLASALAMSKYACKMLLKAHDIPVLPALRLFREDAQRDFDKVLAEVYSAPEFQEFPLFVKPGNLGSSIGISRVKTREEIPAALARAFRYDFETLIEPCVTNLMEINVAVIDQAGVPVSSVVEIPVSESGVLTYEEKYMRGGGGKKGKASGKSRGMAGLTRVIDPDTLDPEIKAKVKGYAEKAFKVLGCSGDVRFDFMMDTGKGEIYFNELNPIPGSFAFYLWAKSKPQKVYTDVLTTILKRAESVHGTKQSLKRDVGFRALKS